MEINECSDRETAMIGRFGNPGNAGSGVRGTKTEGGPRLGARKRGGSTYWQWLRAGQVSPASLFGASDVTFFRSPSNRRVVLSVRCAVRFEEGEKQICEGRA